MVLCNCKVFLGVMVNHTPSFFYWRFLGFLGILITSMGTIFYSGYLVINVLTNSYNMFHMVFEEQYYGAFLLLGFFAIHFAAFCTISKKMYKKTMLSKIQLLLLFSTASSIIIAYFYHYYNT